MKHLDNDSGSVLIFITLMIVLLLIMVGMGLDAGHLVYIRSQGQPAVDAAALAAASALPTGNLSTVQTRAASIDPGGTNPGVGNNYLDSPHNAISASNVTLVQYDSSSGSITTAGVTIANANGVRVALESSNPYGGTVGAPMKSPLFLAPLLKFLGQNTAANVDVSVSAVAVIKAVPGMPIAIDNTLCGKTGNQDLEFNPHGNSGWTTYSLGANTPNIKALFEQLPSCGGSPAVELGFCTNLQNGTIGNLFNTTIPNLFADNPGACYLLPVVGDIKNHNFNQCAPITDWAKFCPNSNPSDAVSGHTLNGTITCGQSPSTSRDTQCYVPRLVRDTKSGM
jgi:Flp pilus assembly protein TadG